MDPIPHTSPRLSERRGKPELQLLDAVLPVLPSSATIEADVHSSNSSIRSGILLQDDTIPMHGPVTPPVRKLLASPFGVSSSVVGSPIKEEEEEEQGNCNCQECGECVNYQVNGLGLDVISLDRKQQDMGFVDPNPHSHFPFGDPASASHYHYDEKLAPVTMPPTPPSQTGERPYGHSLHASPTSQTIDADAFSSGPPSLPQSPQSETTRSRTATILNKVVPSKLRASLKRRLSGPNSPSNNHPPPLPPLSTMPTYSTVSAPGTPPEEICDFGGLFVKPNKSSPVTEDNASAFSSMEAMLPPMVNPLSPSSLLEVESCISSPRPSPRAAGGLPWLTTTEVFPEMSHLGSANELVSSPLHPPTKSPLMSPSIASGSQTSLNGSMAPPVSAHKKVPSIDPATPLAPRKAAVPLTLVTANSLADMIEEMNTDLDAYDATRARMIESGWSSPQEIRNVELQRKDKACAWQERIAESKKILEGMRRSEVKHSAMSSVSSFDSVGSSIHYMPPAAPGSAPLTNSHVTSIQSLSLSASTTTSAMTF